MALAGGPTKRLRPISKRWRFWGVTCRRTFRIGRSSKTSIARNWGMSVSVVCRGGAKTYPSGDEAVRPLDLCFVPGQTTALVGPSGCGKSTLLRMIAGLEDVTEGDLTIDGAPPSEI